MRVGVVNFILPRDKFKLINVKEYIPGCSILSGKAGIQPALFPLLPIDYLMLIT